MFYSHEILSSSQYGVATIWLVATVGKGTNRKVTRKAIQDVDVPKACATFIEPGTPLALRLQGNLLYGTARVFAQQCGYVLADAEKTQSDMKTFFRVVQTSEIDPEAGKAIRQNIILPDDPNFDPFAVMRSLDLLNTNTELIFNYSQASGTKYSQFSPPDLSLQQSTPRSQPSFNGLDLPASSHSAGTYRLPSDLGYRDSPFMKQPAQFDAMEGFNPFGDDQMDPMAAIGLDFDEHGNLIGVVDHEPELPQMLGASDTRPSTSGAPEHVQAMQDGDMPLLGDDGMLLMEEPPLPDAEAFAVKKHTPTDESHSTESVETGRATAKNKRAPRRKGKPALMLDDRAEVSRNEIKNWAVDYLERMEASRKQKSGTTPADAKKNALAFILGNGVADVGKTKEFGGMAHPLASYFAGEALEALLQGREPSLGSHEKHSRRRSSEEAFGSADEADDRRVKQKTGNEAEIGRNLQDDDGDMLMLGDDTAPEMGMEPQSAMADRHSSTIMPWSRAGSAVPGSSVRGPGSAQKLGPAPSPLLGRGKIIPAIERHSDPAVPTSDDFGQLQLPDDSSMSGLLAEPVGDIQIDTDFGGLATLDAASQQFLGYVTEQVTEKGIAGSSVASGEPNKRRWVDFGQLADPQTHSKAVAAQAFLHVLSLATKNVIAVQQDGLTDFVPFGVIRVGVPVSLVDSGDMMEVETM